MPTLYRPIELSFRTQYAEVKERSRAQGPLLPGTPGTLDKAAKDLQQAATLMAILIEQLDESLDDGYEAMPRSMRTDVRSHGERLVAALDAHPQAQDAVSKRLKIAAKSPSARRIT